MLKRFSLRINSKFVLKFKKLGIRKSIFSQTKRKKFGEERWQIIEFY